MMGLTEIQRNCIDYLRAYSGAHDGVMPTYRDIADHLGYRSISRVHQLLVTLEDRGAVKRIAAKARALEIVEPSSFRAVLLTAETFGLVKSYSGSRQISVDTAVNAIIKERLGVAA